VPGLLSGVPWLLPGTALSIVAGVALSRSVAERLRSPRALGFALVAALGVIASVTLTPIGEATGGVTSGLAGCDLTRLGPPAIADLLTLNDVSLNVLLFFPLGMTIGMVPAAHARALLVVAAIVLPFAVERIQLVYVVLGRGCQGADIIDNLIGLALGLAAGSAALAIATRRRHPTHRTSDPSHEDRG
jgi:hypothetical protein